MNKFEKILIEMTTFMTGEHKVISKRGYFKNKKEKTRSRFITLSVLILIAGLLSMFLPKGMHLITNVLLFSSLISYVTGILLTITNKDTHEETRKLEYNSLPENYVLKNELLLNKEKEINGN